MGGWGAGKKVMFPWDGCLSKFYVSPTIWFSLVAVKSIAAHDNQNLKERTNTVALPVVLSQVVPLFSFVPIQNMGYKQGLQDMVFEHDCGCLCFESEHQVVIVGSKK